MEHIMDAPEKKSFDYSAESQTAQPGILREYAYFMSRTKKWWLTPIVLILLIIGVLVVIGGSAAAPFIYTLF
jgi:hypothetical protein